jgi:hypothetical protein
LAVPENNTGFADQLNRARQAIAQLQSFFGPKNRSQFLDTLDSNVARLRNSPGDFQLIKQLIEAGPQVLRLVAGPAEGEILEDQIKNLVRSDELKQELNELESELREFIQEQDNNLTHRMLEEIQRLAELIRLSQNRSILETICKTESLYTLLAGIADTITGGHGAFTALTKMMALVLKVNGTAKKKLDDTLLDYVDGLQVKMSDFRTRLTRGEGILAIQDAESAKPYTGHEGK